MSGHAPYGLSAFQTRGEIGCGSGLAVLESRAAKPAWRREWRIEEERHGSTFMAGNPGK
jgi:hypothetical protein